MRLIPIPKRTVPEVFIDLVLILFDQNLHLQLLLQSSKVIAPVCSISQNTKLYMTVPLNYPEICNFLLPNFYLVTQLPSPLI
jgi:hypothetical protein